MNSLVTVIIPSYHQSASITQSLESLLMQTSKDWQAFIMNSDANDNTEEVIEPYLSDTRFQYFELTQHIGTNRILTFGLELVNTPYVAYLPANSVFYSEHIEILSHVLNEHNDLMLAFTGITDKRITIGRTSGYPFQPVQIMHKKTNHKWTGPLFFEKMHSEGAFAQINKITSELLYPTQNIYKTEKNGAVI